MEEQDMDGNTNIEYNNILNLLREKPEFVTFNRCFNLFKRGKWEGIELKPVRIAILRTFTIEPLIPVFGCKCYQMKLRPEFYLGDYNIVEQEILQPNSELYRFQPEILILSLRPQEFCPKLLDSFLEFSPGELRKEVERVIMTIDNLLSTLRSQSDAKVILHNFELCQYPTLGILDIQRQAWTDPERSEGECHGQNVTLRNINEQLRRVAAQYKDVFLLDYEHLISQVGRARWFDEKMWITAKMPLSREALIVLAEEYARFIRAIKGLSKKCLVLDLDNTLWGGIIGEDGIDGIKLGPEYPGKAYVDFQKAVLNLYNRGIILAINSKNNESDVWNLIENHPSMVLRKKHFASSRINWQDKATNMLEIANELNIGMDSMLFMDDSEFECAYVQQNLPEVFTVQLPKDNPFAYRNILLSLCVFDTLSYSEEDKKRGELYQAQVKREQLRKQVQSLDDFYRSLEMELIIRFAEPKTIPRIAQLTQRTNQFNTTTRRYSEGDIQRFAESLRYNVYSLQLKDRFGDNGIIGVCIVDKAEKQWHIDTFLLSCRVIGRTVETAFLAYLCKQAREAKIEEIRGEYIPTSKNEPVKDLFQRHGFDKVSDNNGKSVWKLNPNTSAPSIPEWIKITCD